MSAGPHPRANGVYSRPGKADGGASGQLYLVVRLFPKSLERITGGENVRQTECLYTRLRALLTSVAGDDALPTACKHPNAGWAAGRRKARCRPAVWSGQKPASFEPRRCWTRST